MALPTVTVQGKVLEADGSGMPGGRIVVQLSAAGKVNDGSVDQLVAGKSEYRIESDGSVGFEIIPNDQITPSGSFYRVTVEDTDGRTKRKLLWQLASTPDPIDVGAIPAPTF